MIVAIVTFSGIEADRFQRAAQERRLFYEGLPGLVQKIYFISPDGTEGGGIYLWDRRETAEGVYTEEWLQRATETFGARPEIRYADITDIILNEPIPRLTPPGQPRDQVL